MMMMITSSTFTIVIRPLYHSLRSERFDKSQSTKTGDFGSRSDVNASTTCPKFAFLVCFKPLLLLVPGDFKFRVVTRF